MGQLAKQLTLLMVAISFLCIGASTQTNVPNKKLEDLHKSFSHEIYKKMAEYVCPCASTTKNTADTVFYNCIFQAAMVDSIGLINEVIRVYGDTTEETMVQWGIGVGKYLTIYMMEDCDWLYDQYDSIKNHGFDANNSDSLLEQLKTIRSTPKQTWPSNYYLIEGVYHFMIKQYDSAAVSLDHYLQDNPYIPDVEYIKGLALEKATKFDEAIAIYEGIYDKTGNFQYKVFVASAIAAKKKALKTN